MKKIILVIAVLGLVGGIPLNRNEKCERVDKELKLFRDYISNGTNFNDTIDSVMSYFNTSSLYTPILVDKIQELCSKNKTKEIKV